MTPPTVWMKPNTEVAIPATSPSGSIDSEFMFATAHPKQDMMIASRGRNSQNCRGWILASISHRPLTIVKTMIAVWESCRIPSRATSRELVNEASPIRAATEAKATGNQFPKW